MPVKNLEYRRPLKLILTKGSYLFLALFLCSVALMGQKLETGIASYYNDNLQGRMTASGEAYDTIKMTAAHPSLPFQTKVKVKVLSSGKHTIVRINDRGPFVQGRILDVSKAAARKLKILDKGLAKVSVEVVYKP